MTNIDIHIIQSVPPSNLNRDDNGSPKTAIYGGLRRARVSSQAWKRATREAFEQHLDAQDVGKRTKRVAELIAARIKTLCPDTSDEDASSGAWAALTAVGLKPEKTPKDRKSKEVPQSQYLVFFSNPQMDALAELAVTNDLRAVPPRDAKAAVKRDHGISVSLFGRMIADDADLNVDAAVQVAHAISTHAVDSEFDFYAAVDDENPESETGAGMMGTIEFNSSTLYRYASISLDALQDNLGDTVASRKAIEAFVEAFARSMPSGKQNTFANGTLPHAVVVVAREGQGINWVGAYEDAVKPNDQGFIESSCEALAQHAQDLGAAFGDAPLGVWVTAVGAAGRALSDLGDPQPFPQLIADLGNFVESQLGETS